MWKRWSFNILSAPQASPGEDKVSSPSAATTTDTAAGPAPTPKLSGELVAVAEDTVHEDESLDAPKTPASSAQVATEKSVVPDTSTRQISVTVSDTSSKEDRSMAGDDAKSPIEHIDDDTAQKASSPPDIGSSFDDNIPSTHDSGLVVSTHGVIDDGRIPSDSASLDPDAPARDDATNTAAPPSTLPVPQQETPPPRGRRLSFRSFAFFYGRDKEPSNRSPSPSPISPKSKLADPISTTPRHPPKPKLSRSDKKALSSALVLRNLIIGPGSVLPTDKRAQNKLVHTSPAPDLHKVKSQLLKPKKANAVIAQLRRLPLPDGPTVHASGNASSESLVTHPDAGGTPIHAVCLAVTDEEADKLYFSRLSTGHAATLVPSPQSKVALSAAGSTGLLGVANASLESLLSVLKDLQLVSLLESPDLGFGQPVSEEGTGPLTGSVPSAEAIINGFEEITKQLMSLGFATSKAVFPSHTGIYPPEDRMSVLTYWWGLELVMPEPSVKYLGKVKSISHAVLNFLSAVAFFNNGVREVLPFIRYIANFVDFEWSAIQTQDRGRGVVCAATWVMPAAMVPRPWDFPSRPASKSGPTATTPTVQKPDPTPAPVPDNGTGDNKNKGSVPQTPQESVPAAPSSMPFPPALMSPMLPTLMVTPATLPRAAILPQHQGISA